MAYRSTHTGAQIDAAIDGMNSGVIGFATKALMDADLAHDDAQVAIVTNDATPEYNKFYRKSGASGGGSWLASQEIGAKYGAEINVHWFGAVGDGATDDSSAIQAAIDYITTGTIIFGNKTYRVTNIAPKSGITLKGNGTTLKQVAGASTPIIYYYSDAILNGFNLRDLTLNGDLVAQPLVSIDQPNPTVPGKTWYDSIVDNCRFLNSGSTGLYCPVPGSVRVNNCYFGYNDVGLAWDREHMYVTDTVFWENRVGIRSTGNHFVCKNTVFAHNTEYGWTMTGAGLGLYSDVYEGAFIGCSFINNAVASIDATLTTCRVIGCRFIGDTLAHITASKIGTIISSNEFMDASTACLQNVESGCIVNGNFFNTAVSGGNAINIAEASRGVGIYGNRFSSTPVCIVCPKAGDARIDNNIFYSCGVGVISDNTNGCVGGLSISNNTFSSMTGLCISLIGDDTQNDDFVIDNNTIISCSVSAIVASGAGSSYGWSVRGNKVKDAGTSNSGSPAILIERNLLAGNVSGNTIRNSTAGHATYAIQCPSVGSGADTLFDGNISRGMSPYAYKAQTGYSLGTNVGTFE